MQAHFIVHQAKPRSDLVHLIIAAEDGSQLRRSPLGSMREELALLAHHLVPDAHFVSGSRCRFQTLNIKCIRSLILI